MHRKSISGEYMRFPNQNQINMQREGPSLLWPIPVTRVSDLVGGGSFTSSVPPYHVYWQCKVLYISPHPETAVQKAADMTDISVLSF